jgi:peroxiredoxin
MTPEPAYNFTLQTLDGDLVSLADYQGQWVLLNFWATWCAPCAKEMPYLQALADAGDIVVLGVNFNESPAAVAEFVSDYNLTFPILLNPDDVVLTMYKVRALPRTFVIAPDGMVVQQFYGEIVPAQFEAWLEEQVR